jgi:hypothetical protein
MPILKLGGGEAVLLLSSLSDWPLVTRMNPSEIFGKMFVIETFVEITKSHPQLPALEGRRERQCHPYKW